MIVPKASFQGEKGWEAVRGIQVKRARDRQQVAVAILELEYPSNA